MLFVVDAFCRTLMSSRAWKDFVKHHTSKGIIEKKLKHEKVKDYVPYLFIEFHILLNTTHQNFFKYNFYKNDAVLHFESAQSHLPQNGNNLSQDYEQKEHVEWKEK